MAQLMLHRDILKTFRDLPVKVQKRVGEFVDRFQQDPTDPGLRVHPLKGAMLDPKVRGAELPGGYRAILIAPEKGDTYMMVHIAAHDDAYQWAENKRFEVHEMTGLFQVFGTDIQQADDAIETRQHPTDEELAQHFQKLYRLAELSEEDLYRAGVPQPLVPSVRRVRSDEGLEALLPYLPPDCRDVLLGIAAGMSVDQALAEMLGLDEATPTPDGPGDFTGIETRPNADLVLLEPDDSLSDILVRPLDEWRVFLHPTQRKVVTWDVNGPMKITGAAGTGKTVALMHRAVRLARDLGTSRDRILVTTFTTNLSITIKAQLHDLAPTVADRIEVTNLHALAREILRRTGWHGRIADESEKDEIWKAVKQVSSLPAPPMSWEDLRDEYDLIVDPNGVDSEEAYLTVVRSGRPRVSRRQRREAWPFFRAFQRALKGRNLLTFEGAIHEARLAAERGTLQAYRHVLVDEVQDFGLEALRLVRALAPVEEDGVNPLCLVGDPHQRIYGRPIPMIRAGIGVRGRSRRLKVNYRTTEEIRRYAHRLLEGLSIDDFEDGEISTKGDHSILSGLAPIIKICKDEEEEAATIVAWVEDLLDAGGLSSHEICIVPMKPTIRTAIMSAGLPSPVELRAREMDPGAQESGVRMGTMKRIKGLEFRAVAMACADAEDPMNHLNEAEDRSRCERYVAATRAREHLLVTIASTEDQELITP